MHYLMCTVLVDSHPSSCHTFSMDRYLVGHFLEYEGFSIDSFSELSDAHAHYDWCGRHGYTDQLFLAEVKLYVPPRS